MQDIQAELIEKYQILLQKDPKSQVFAPLAEAYRKMGLVEEAFRIAVRGVQFNPNFSGGRIALAKIFLDRQSLPAAIDELEKAISLSPDNILAHSLLADCYLKDKRPKEALKSFKMVLFLAPTNEKALKAVQKLEALTADEYEDDLFEMKPLRQVDALSTETPESLKPLKSGPELERHLSLIDAYIVRNDMDRAIGTLKQAELLFPGHTEITKRFKIINQRGAAYESSSAPTGKEPPPSREGEARERKIKFLEGLLRQIQEKSQFT